LGLYLIGFIFDTTLMLGILKVAIGLGMVIFVHELGHFVVAKLCGVKCEKFYLGFDIAGWKFCKFTWGETEYGIGVLPLGGYVKMLGQEDNPARLREEMERAKAEQAAETADANGSGQPDDAAPTGDDVQPDDAKDRQTAATEALFDPRSYLAQSVPKRMAIISAGVIMNVIFAFVMAMISYWMGVEQIVCGIGDVLPGEAAWRNNLKVDDQIVEIAGEKVHRFRDLQARISLGDIDGGVPLVVRRPGVDREFSVTVTPDRVRLIPTIGIVNPRTTTLLESENPVRPGSPAALARPEFQSGDKIVRIGTRHRPRRSWSLSRWLPAGCAGWGW